MCVCVAGHYGSLFVGSDGSFQLTRDCLSIISSNNYWQLALQVFLSDTTDAGETQRPQQSLGEFLSLTAELLRHASLIPSSAVTTNLQQCIATSLGSVLSLLQKFSNIFIVKRFIDVALKLVDTEELAHYVASTLKKLFCLSVFKSIVCEWLLSHAEEFELTSHCKSGAVKQHSSASERELVDIAVRKTVLLVLKCIACLLQHTQSHTMPSSGELEHCTYGTHIDACLMYQTMPSNSLNLQIIICLIYSITDSPETTCNNRPNTPALKSTYVPQTLVVEMWS